MPEERDRDETADPATEALDFDYRPRPLGRVRPARSPLRWPIIAAAASMALIALVAVRGLGTISESQAEEKLAEYSAALSPFSSALRSLSANLPAVDDEALSSFQSAMEDLRAVATSDLPGLPPFVPQGSLGEVSAAQDRLLQIADEAESIAADLEAGSAFREAAAGVFDVPSLPFSAPPELVDAAAEAISTMEATTRSALAGLPPGAAFESFVGRAEEALEFVPGWSTSYLEALRAGDDATAESAIAQIEARRRLLDAELESALEEIAGQLEPRLEELTAAVEQAQQMTAG